MLFITELGAIKVLQWWILNSELIFPSYTNFKLWLQLMQQNEALSISANKIEIRK